MFSSRNCARTGTLTNCYTYTSHSLRERTVPLKYAGERKSTMWIPNLEFCEKYDNLNFNLRKLETPIPNRKRRSNCVACAPALYPVSPVVRPAPPSSLLQNIPDRWTTTLFPIHVSPLPPSIRSEASVQCSRDDFSDRTPATAFIFASWVRTSIHRALAALAPRQNLSRTH